MKGFKALMILFSAALLIAGCAVPLGEDYLITRDGAADIIYITDYNLQSYVPIPAKGQTPVFSVSNRSDLEMSVLWKDENGTEIPLPFETFVPNTVYKAEIKITPKPNYAFYSAPFAYPAGKISAQIDDLGDPTRTFTVTYNNSDDADITFITDYNLQNYVPIPLAGEKPVQVIETRADVRVQAVWKPENGTYATYPDSFAFDLGVVYQADIRLTAKSGYRFIPNRSFAYPNGIVATSIPESTPDTVRYEVTYLPTVRPMPITDFNLTSYIPKPIGGATPVMSFAGIQYTGTVNWKNTNTQEVLAGPFLPGTAYTAELTLSPGPGYAFAGSEDFIHPGAETITYQGSGSLTVTFSATASASGSTVVYDTILTDRLPKPVHGITPVKGITSPQYTGTVAWTPDHGTFQMNTNYKAVLTLTAVPGFTFTGIGQNVFRHGDAPGAVTNASGSGTVTITFPTAARPPSHLVMTFGPPDAENSALKVLKERSTTSNQVNIDLSPSSEPEHIDYSATLLPYDTSSVNVVIDGQGRILKKTTPGTLITVPGSVTLTLKNITLEGFAANSAPLIEVLPGGSVILESGAVLKDNITSSSDAGGVRISGGTLIMHTGSEIKGITAARAGGVLIRDGGWFLMDAGTIENNTVTDVNSGGAVLVDDGIFDMQGGTIQNNTANAANSGGGVAVIERGRFTQQAGSIKNNQTMGARSGGGVYGGVYTYSISNSITIEGSAEIEGNTAWEVDSGGGVGIQSDNTNSNSQVLLAVNGGTIKNNTARGARSGGGVYILGRVFTMSGGRIENNTAGGADSGGGVYSSNDFSSFQGSCALSGGTIANNTANAVNSGGGIYSHNGVQITGVTIERNTAGGANSGGGVYISGKEVNETPSYFYQGTIANNTANAANSGGGVYVAKTGSLNMHAAKSLNDPAPPSTVGQIRGNTAAGIVSAGAVYIDGDTTSQGQFTMALKSANDGAKTAIPTIEANTARNEVTSVNGVYVKGKFELSWGNIKGNTGNATYNYGVYVANTGLDAFKMKKRGRVSGENQVYLVSGATINVADSLEAPGSGEEPVVARIISTNPQSYQYYNTNATKLLNSNVVSYLDGNRFYYWLNSTIKIDSTSGPPYYGYFNGP
jgi:hypothetical protein